MRCQSNSVFLQSFFCRPFQAAQQWSHENDRPIFLGEFGAYDKAPMDSRVRYTSAVARAAESLHWSWACWQFDSDFILYDLGEFKKMSDAVSNYTTEGPIAYNIADGQEKTYSVLVSGFSAVHFDVYGCVDTLGMDDPIWAINPASHDASMVPEPATICLLGLGSAVMIRSRKHRKG